MNAEYHYDGFLRDEAGAHNTDCYIVETEGDDERLIELNFTGPMMTFSLIAVRPQDIQDLASWIYDIAQKVKEADGRRPRKRAHGG